MAFQKTKFKTFFNFLKEVQRSSLEMRTIAENFILEERLSEAREDNYAKYVSSSIGIDDWNFEHENYFSDKIKVHKGTPESFTDMNKLNFKIPLEQNQFVVRLEQLASLVKIARYDDDINGLSDYFIKFLKDETDKEATAVVKEFLYTCNKNRDFHPIFVGFWGEVKDLFYENDNQWANKLRDRFGLGHIDPIKRDPIPVLLLRYRIDDVMSTNPLERNFFAIPTILDSKMNPFFCPSPKDWTEGQTLDLSLGTIDDYAFICEILHRYIEYKVSYVYHFGWITESPGKTCEEARKIHFEYMKDEFKHFDQLEK